VISFNANGLPARHAKDSSLVRAPARDVLCVQELKAHDHSSPTRIRGARLSSRAARRAETRIQRRRNLLAWRAGNVGARIGVPELDAEGRYLEAHFGSVAIASAYFPSAPPPGAAEAKFRFLAASTGGSRTSRATACLRICGDFTWRTSIDLKIGGTSGLSGSLTGARLLDTLFDGRGFVDAFRAVNQTADQYTCGRARAAWRITWVAHRLPGVTRLPPRQGAAIYKNGLLDHAAHIDSWQL